MKSVLKISILRGLSDNGYRIALDDILIDQKPDVGLSEFNISTHKIAEILDMGTLMDMLKYKKGCEQLKKLFFVSNRELSEWVDAKKGRRIHLVLPGTRINDGISYDKWAYDEDSAELSATCAGDIFVAEAGSSNLEHLTRRVIGLDV